MKNAISKFFNKKKEILLDEEEQKQFFDNRSKKASLAEASSKSAIAKKRRKEDAFDRENGIPKGNAVKSSELAEKCLILIVICGLIIVLACMCAFLISTFDEETFEKKTMFLDNKVLRPQIDKNEYKYITLSNQIQGIIVVSKEVQKSSFALDVHTGSWQEPQHVPGLAHLLEHMIFVQSEKHPQKYLFDEFLSLHGGYSSSFTTHDHTNFFFTVGENGLEEGLEIFSSLLSSPTFDLETAKQESSIIDSEFRVRLKDNLILNLLQFLCDAGHPLSRFTAGNAESLRDNSSVDILEELNSYKNDYYSGNIMKLVVLTPEKMEDVESYLQQFDKISNSQVDKPANQYTKPLSNCSKIVKVRSESDFEQINIIFQLQIDRSMYQKRPLELISFILNDPNENSLKYKLQEFGVSDISTSVLLDNCNYQLFQLKLQTQNIYQYAKIFNAIFNYFEFLLQSSEESSLKDLYNQRAKVANITFTYKTHLFSSEESLKQTAWNLNEFDYKDIFIADRIWNPEFDQDYFNGILKQMKDISNVIVILESNQFEDNEGEEEEDSNLDNQVQAEEPKQVEEKILEQTQLELNEGDSLNDDDVKAEIDNIARKVEEQNDLDWLKNNKFDTTVPLYDFAYSERSLSEVEVSEMIQIDQKLISSFQLEKINSFVPKELNLIDICTQMDINTTKISSINNIPEKINLNLLEIKEEVETKKGETSTKVQQENKQEEGKSDQEKQESTLESSSDVTSTDIQNEKIYQNIPGENCEDRRQQILEQVQVAKVIKRENGIEGWYKLSNNSPLVEGIFLLKFNDLEKINLNDEQNKGEIEAYSLIDAIFTKLLEQEISQTLSHALEAGYSIEVETREENVQFKVNGWSESFELAVKQLFEKFNHIEYSEFQFEVAKESVIHDLLELQKQSPLIQAKQYILPLIISKVEFSSWQTIMIIIQSINYQMFSTHVNTYRQKNYQIVSLIVGNISPQNAQELFNSLETPNKLEDKTSKYSSNEVLDEFTSKILDFQTSGWKGDLRRSVITFYQIQYEERQIGEFLVQMLRDLLNKSAIGFQTNIELLEINKYLGILIEKSSKSVSLDQIILQVNHLLEELQDNVESKLEENIIQQKNQQELEEKENLSKKHFGSLSTEAEDIWIQIMSRENVTDTPIELTHDNLMSFYKSILQGQRKEITLKMSSFFDISFEDALPLSKKENENSVQV